MLLDPLDLGKAIKALRGPRTQSDVAEQGGLPASQWSIYETGKRWPTDETLTRLIKGLGCTEEILFEEILKARGVRLGRREERGGGGAGFPDHNGSDLQPLLTELRSLRSHLSLLGTYVIGLERRVEQFLGVPPAPGPGPAQPS